MAVLPVSTPEPVFWYFSSISFFGEIYLRMMFCWRSGRLSSKHNLFWLLFQSKLFWIVWPAVAVVHPGSVLTVCCWVYFLPSSGQTPPNAALQGRTGTKPWWLWACVCMCVGRRKVDRPNLCVCTRTCVRWRESERNVCRGTRGDSRGSGSAPSSSVLLRWWMERSVCRRLSAVALARAAASEHGQLLWTRGSIVRIQSERSKGSAFVFKVAQKKIWIDNTNDQTE